MKWTIAVATPLFFWGCIDPSAFQVQEADEATAASETPPAAEGAASEPAAAPLQGEAAIPDVSAKIVEKSKALEEKPHLVEVQNTIRGSDPLTAYADAYFSAASRVETLAFTQQIQIHQATHDKYPTFDEFMGYYKQAGVELKGVKPWQMYAYDPADGSIVILEDREEKKRRFEAAGIEYTD